MSELLILKAGKQYFRFKGDTYHTCAMNKASVFPPDQIETIKKLRNRLDADGIEGSYIAKLTITEEPYKE